MANNRDEFSAPTKRTIANRAGYKCSVPSCRKTTVGPHVDAEKSVLEGRASHIKAASPGGPRYDPHQTPKDRKSARNGIWLCVEHANRVDVEDAAFPVEKLLGWKQEHENWVKRGCPVDVYNDQPKLELSFVSSDVVTQDNTRGCKVIPHGVTIRAVRFGVYLPSGKLTRGRAHLLSINPDPIGYGKTGVRALGWEHSNDGDDGRDLIPGVRQRVDVAYTISPPFCMTPYPYLYFFTTPPHQITIPGAYVFEMQVFGDNLGKVRIKLEIGWDGVDFNSLNARQISCDPA